MIVLSPTDNVAVCRRNVAKGETLAIEGGALVARGDVPLGHKVACRRIARGAAVIKYGMTIGTATADIETGDWVHLHNLQSNYIATRLRTAKVSS
ncbi:UxaA family hydrolase [Hephaestia sp. GCM10023244]